MSMTFDTYRPGWGKPIHKVMEDEGVNVFFQGHDHLFAWEKVGSIIYQEVPMPSDSSYNIGFTDNGDAYTDVKLEGSGHLRVKVKPECVTVDYVRAYLPKDTINGAHKNQEVAFSYTIGNCITATKDKENSEVNIFPNPTNDLINIVFNELVSSSDKYNIQIMDIHGRKHSPVISDLSNGYQVNMQDLPKGIYVVIIKSTTKSIYKKIINQ